MRSESVFSHSFRKCLTDQGAMVQSIESGLTGTGIPDIYVRTRKISAWIELKNLIYPIRSYIEIPFRPGQLAWLIRHHNMGGVSVLAVAHPGGFWFFKGSEICATYKYPFPYSLAMTRLSGEKIIYWLEE